jgi:putative ABC transport system permease protein
MAIRELRAAWKQLALFFVCIAIGVGAIVAIRSFIASVETFAAGQARAMNGSDISVQTDREPAGEVAAAVERALASPGVVGHTRTLSTVTMIRPMGDSTATAKAVELEGVEQAFPLYGDLILANGVSYSFELLRDGGALVSRSLATQLDLDVGDRVRLGTREFEVRGIVERQPSANVSVFSFGTRVTVSREDLLSAGLLGFGSRSRHRLLLKVSDSYHETVLEGLKGDLSGTLATVRGYREAQESLSAQLNRASDYLSLAGLAILVLGGVGVWSVTRVFVRQRVGTIAVLKCLGSSNAQVIAAYTGQSVALGALGSILGIGMAAVILAALSGALAGGPLGEITVGVRPGVAAQGVAVGVLVSALFSLTPLVGIRDVKAGVVLRGASTGTVSRRIDRWTLLAGGASLAALVALSMWQAGSPGVGLVFLGALVGTALLLALVGEALVRVVARARPFASFTLRYAITGLKRPGNQTRAVLVAVGLGVFFVCLAQSLKVSVLSALESQLDEDLPDMYLVDVQEDQRDGVARIVAGVTGAEPLLVPTLRVRITALDGAPVDVNRIRDSGNRGRLAREYTVTSRAGLDEHERVIAGSWWDEASAETPEISIEESLAEAYGLGVGSTMTFDVLGEQVVARIASVRHVDWERTRVGFMVLFRPGTLEQYPRVYIGAFNGPRDPGERGKLGREVATAYPNVSLLDAFDIVSAVRRVLSGVTLAVSIVGLFVAAVGFVILAGSIAFTRLLRLYESAVLRSLGATSRTLLSIATAEFLLEGMLAGIVGAAVASAVAWLTATELLEVPWVFDPWTAFGIPLAAALLSALVGAVTTLDSVFVKPLGLLRAE